MQPAAAVEAPAAPAHVEARTHVAARCRNCGAEIGGNYCANCGQETAVELPPAGRFLREAAGRHVALDGRLSIIAFLGGAVAEKVNLGPFLRRRARVMGSAMRPRTAAEKQEIRDELLENAWPWLDAGRIAPVIQAVLPFGKVTEAHRMMEQGDHIGKIVLVA